MWNNINLLNCSTCTGTNVSCFVTTYIYFLICRAPFACPAVNGMQPGGMSVTNSLSNLLGAPPFRPQVSMQSSQY